MEINNRVLFDASTYVLFEATGDSEAKHFGGDLESQHSDDDDALSCSYFRSVKKVDGGDDEDDNLLPGADFDFGDWVVGVEDDGGGMSDLEDGVVNQCRGGGGKAAAAAKEMVKVKKSKGCCEDKSVKMVSEREGDRLFWEACLASKEFNFEKMF